MGLNLFKLDPVAIGQNEPWLLIPKAMPSGYLGNASQGHH